MNYLVSKNYDLKWIIGPAFMSSIFVVVFYLLGLAPQTTSPAYWLIFVVFIDVSHVWSTLFRTYLHKENKMKYEKSLWLVPLCCYIAGVFLYSFGSLVFWRTLAYLAVFHFIRQQYGIFQLYSKKIKQKKIHKRIDQLNIYAATVIPIMIWHLGGIQEIHWFMPGDFYYLNLPHQIIVLQILALLIFFVFLIKEIFILKAKILSPKTTFLCGTILSWWVGIVWINTDWAFTITNVVTHGIPYFALIYHQNIKARDKILWIKSFPTITIFLFLFFIGYLEEGLWDIFIWKEHAQLFPFSDLSLGLSHYAGLALLVPLLALPQATHYVLDGIIWKKNR